MELWTMPTQTTCDLCGANTNNGACTAGCSRRTTPGRPRIHASDNERKNAYRRRQRVKALRLEAQQAYDNCGELDCLFSLLEMDLPRWMERIPDTNARKTILRAIAQRRNVWDLLAELKRSQRVNAARVESVERELRHAEQQLTPEDRKALETGAGYVTGATHAIDQR